MTPQIIHHITTHATRYQNLMKLLLLLILLLALANGVLADGMTGGSACPGC